MPTRRLRLEALEERRLLAVATVTTNLDVVDLSDGVTSLREAIFAANTLPGADTIEFEFGHDGPATILLTMGELAITDSLTINGPGAGLLTIDASGNDPTPDSIPTTDSSDDGDGSRVFNIDDGVLGTAADPQFIDVTLRGLTITGGDVDEMGGGILSYENLTVDDCVVTGNTAFGTNVNGGGILAIYGSLTVDSSTVSHNFATGNGGGIDFNPFSAVGANSTMTVTNSDVRDNRSNKSGGGLQIVGPAEITDSTIAGNRSVTGGGIHVQPSNKHVEILRTQIANNTATDGGGVGATPFGSGQFSVRIVDSSIAGNIATRSGGGVFNSVPAPFGFPPAAVFEVIDTTIVDNQAIDGGGFYWGSNYLARIEGSTIAENRATRDGGGMWNWTQRVTVVDSKFERNTASRNGGGALSVGSVVIDGIEFVENSAGSGGGLYATSDGSLAPSVVISDSAFVGNTATGEGGGIRASLPLTLERSIVKDNQTTGSSSGRGGGISSAAVTIRSSVIAGNSTRATQASGGGVAATGTVLIEDSSIIRNSTTGGDSLGGGIWSVEPSMTVVSSTISGNTTAGQNSDGAGIAAVNPTIRYSTITDNHALGSSAEGGGIAAQTFRLHHTIVAGNSALGGKPDVRYDLTPVVDNSLIGDKAGTTLVESQSPNAQGSLIGNSAGGGVIDPLLLPLANYGGPEFIDGSRMLTHALLPSSPAIDAGLASAVAGVGLVPLHDQRGAPHLRVLDGDGAGGARIDIGAYEREFGETYTFVVDTLVDESDGDYSAGDFSLREAIELANTNPGADTIEFDPALTANGPATILMTQGELSITDSVTIHGPGANLLTIDASGNDPTPDSTLTDGDNTNDGDGGRVFYVSDGQPTIIDVAISGLTLTGGDSNGGGAILSLEGLELLSVWLTGNIAFAGGGVHGSDQLTVVDSVISHNESRRQGGGINVFGGSLSVIGSDVSNNTTTDAFGMGGGIAVNNANIATDPDAFVRIERSVISQNAARGTFAPGGISISGDAFNNPIEVTISGSTISENTASGHVAGVYLSGANATIEDSTISSNRYVSRAGVSLFPWTPGGIYLDSTELALVRSTVVDNLGLRQVHLTPTGNGIHVNSQSGLSLDHSIVARNRWTAGPGNPVDIVTSFGAIVANSSLIGATEEIVNGGGNLIGTAAAPIDPRLGPLVYNGGPVFADGTPMLTHALLPGSPAIDAGDPAAVAGMNGVPHFDQRGMPWGRVASGRIDMGAVERQANPLPGDYNFNGVVDAADYSIWRNTLGSETDLRADGSSASTPGAPDGVVDEHDYAFWKSNFGNVYVEEQGAGSVEQGVSSLSARISEPASQPPALPGVSAGMGAGSMQFDFAPFETSLVGLANAPGKPPAEPGAAGRVNAIDRDEALVALLARRGRGAMADDLDVDFDRGEREADESAATPLDEAFAALALWR